MRRTRGSTDRTHSAFALAITATRSRPRERVGFSQRDFDKRAAEREKRKEEEDFSLGVFGVFSVFARGAKRL